MIIESGTTVYPFFKRIGRAALFHYSKGDRWAKDHLTLVTNNIPGIESLTESGRILPDNRYSDIAVRCMIVPGVPVPVFSGILGRDANEWIEKIVLEKNNEPGKKAVFLGLMTGNWIRLRRSVPRGPVPLARGGVTDGDETAREFGTHLRFKQNLIRHLDEVYVVAPLGKIWSGIDVDSEKVNQVFGYTEKPDDPGKEAYKEVRIDNGDAKKVKLITTSRPDGCLLRTYSNQVRSFLGLPPEEKPSLDRFIGGDIGEIGHILFEYKPLIGSGREEEIEFPHEDLRNNTRVLKTYFCIPS